ncbi:MAG: M23 family metallopeptidase [Acidobacteriota bacterium]
MIAGVLTATVNSSWTLTRPGSSLVVSLQNGEAPIHPGDIVRLTLKSSRPISSATARFSDSDVLLFPSSGDPSWQGLIGIDLETKPGTYVLRGEVELDGGGTLDFNKPVRIAFKKFPVQRIRVNEKYVSLSPEDSERASNETKKLSQLWGSSSANKLWNGPFIKPVDSSLTSGFGRRRIVNGRPRSPHAGVDFKAGSGVPVVAANSGRVVLAEDLFFSGNTVVIDHGLGLYTLYAHCSKIVVQPGHLVRTGDHIADVGATGRVTGPHLHWSCRLKNARVDPLKLLP